MQVSIEDAQGRLEELMERAERGEEIILCIDGRPAVRLEAVADNSAKDAL